jgi:hypothetical protein
MHDETAARAKALDDAYVLSKDDADLIGYVLNGQNFSYTVAKDGRFSWGAFGTTFETMGHLRAVAAENPPPPDAVFPVIEGEGETVGIDLFENMLDTIAFLRVRLRALADVVIEKGLITGPELLGKYHEYHERSFQAFRDLMLLKPEIFEQRFAEWLATENAYRKRLEADKVEP